ncbi:hypothetical protein AWB74_08528 [Caballeronia arvi]|uniref:Uncharacterized protein n=1 Tax=Caballeronia arvi TaxID=1777135 RepID=A0A158L511_9BURK|nr:hypothetical protein AWB74_08528 [Caballeronia arvi]
MSAPLCRRLRPRHQRTGNGQDPRRESSAGSYLFLKGANLLARFARGVLSIARWICRYPDHRLLRGLLELRVGKIGADDFLAALLCRTDGLVFSRISTDSINAVKRIEKPPVRDSYNLQRPEKPSRLAPTVRGIDMEVVSTDRGFGQTLSRWVEDQLWAFSSYMIHASPPARDRWKDSRNRQGPHSMKCSGTRASRTLAVAQERCRNNRRGQYDRRHLCGQVVLNHGGLAAVRALDRIR